MSYNKTYSEIKTLLKTSERVGKTTMLKIARLAIKETLGDRVEIEDIKWDSKFLDLDADKLTEMMMSKAESAGTLPSQAAPEIPVAEAVPVAEAEAEPVKKPIDPKAVPKKKKN